MTRSILRYINSSVSPSFHDKKKYLCSLAKLIAQRVYVPLETPTNCNSISPFQTILENFTIRHPLYVIQTTFVPPKRRRYCPNTYRRLSLKTRSSRDPTH